MYLRAKGTLRAVSSQWDSDDARGRRDVGDLHKRVVQGVKLSEQIKVSRHKDKEKELLRLEGYADGTFRHAQPQDQNENGRSMRHITEETKGVHHDADARSQSLSVESAPHAGWCTLSASLAVGPSLSLKGAALVGECGCSTLKNAGYIELDDSHTGCVGKQTRLRSIRERNGLLFPSSSWAARGCSGPRAIPHLSRVGCPVLRRTTSAELGVVTHRRILPCGEAWAARALWSSPTHPT